MSATQCKQGNVDQDHSMVCGPRVQPNEHDNRISLYSSKLVSMDIFIKPSPYATIQTERLLRQS
jgi:hypothetical protein